MSVPRSAPVTMLEEQPKNAAALFAEDTVLGRGVDDGLAFAEVSFPQGERIRQLVVTRLFDRQVVIVTGSAFDATWESMRPQLLDIARSITPG